MKHLIIILILGVFAVASADTGGALILENANSNENIYVSATGEFISYLRGDVVFRFDDVRMSADEAHWQRHAGIVDFTNNITVEQQGQLMTCDKLNFVRDNNVLIASGNVLYRDSLRITFISGDTAEYRTDRKEARLFGTPLLMRIDTTDTDIDTIFLRGRIVIYDDSLKVATVTDNVDIRRGELVATSQVGKFFPRDNKAMLRVYPVINYEGHRIVGDSVDLFLGKEKLESASVVGNTHGRYTEIAELADTAQHLVPDTTITNIWSDSLHLSMFANGKVDAIKAFGNAHGDYTETSRESNIVTTTEFASDSMHTYMFENGKVRAVKAYGDARGKYSEVNDSANSTMSTAIASDSLHIFMFESGKIGSIHAFGNAHGRSAEWSASSSAPDSSITHIWGDSIRVSMSDAGKIRTMRAFGNDNQNVRSLNFIVNDSARANEITGLRMTLAFSSNGKIDRAAVIGNAKSRYHLEESDGGGVNNASGDRIIVLFSSGKAQRLRVIGNVKGFYAPEQR